MEVAMILLQKVRGEKGKLNWFNLFLLTLISLCSLFEHSHILVYGRRDFQLYLHYYRNTLLFTTTISTTIMHKNT